MSLYCNFGEYAEVYSASVHVSRERRTCDECNGLIEPGERYQRAWMIFEGQQDVLRTCCRCLPMAEWVVRNCGCRMHGDLWRHLEKDVFEEMRGDLAPGVHLKVGRWIVECRRWRAEQIAKAAS